MPSTPAARRITSPAAHAYVVPVVRELPAQPKGDACTW
jgi:hypothetical protein